MQVRVEGGAEAVQEAEGPELCVGGRSGTGVTESRADGAQEDPEDGACDLRVVVQEGT
jgi:hypothetical protein